MLRRLEYKCHFCSECAGYGCVGELPGMGGAFDSANFQANVAGWKKLEEEFSVGKEATPAENCNGEFPALRLAPMTGAVENVGYPDERAFYYDLLMAAATAGFRLALGDGTPDEKLLYGIEAMKATRQFYPDIQAAVFIKPYANEKIFERMEWAREVAEFLGVDIDSYNIVTMRKKAKLEKKTATQLKELKQKAEKPFMIKGLFTPEDVELVREVKPDVAIISNHGGRIETVRGSTAEFLKNYGKELRSNCGQLWVDSGLRTRKDILTAARFGVKEVMIGRPIVTALCRDGVKGVKKVAETLGGNS